MKVSFKQLSVLLLFSTVTSSYANAEWFLRGTHNGWAADQMQDIGANTMLANDVTFSASGTFKVDRFGDWSENYGQGGQNGTNIPAPTGTWDIEFYTDTKNWNILPASTHGGSSTTTYHFRGTPNNWSEGTLLTAVAGTSYYDICVEFTAGDANGGPRFKIDKNGDWGADAFPAQDYNVSAGFAKITVDGASDSIVSVEEGLAENCSGTSIASDFRNRTIYFLFVDRFANGDTSNDNGFNAAATSTTKQNGGLSEWKKYWGGDIQGLIDNLDYLEALGIGAIWVSPLNDNVNNSGSAGAYHGYWGRDFFEVDEHVGTWALVDQLDAEMEARGMKLVLDFAPNHSSQDDKYEFGAVYKEGVFQADKNNSVWFHQNGAIADCYDNDPNTVCNAEYDDPWAFRNKSLFNLTDFNHGTNSNSVADTYLIDAAKKWLSHGVDAIRIDAIKHIEPNFINRFTSALRQINPDIYIFGEWYGAGASNSASMAFLNERRGSELLDFSLRDNIENAIADNSSMIDLDAHIASRAAAMQNAEDWQPIFLDNHDATRTSVYLQTNGVVNSNRQGKGFSKAFADARQNLGMALVMTLPGIPTVYYGTEHNSTWFTANGDGQVGHDPYNREPQPSFAQSGTAFTLIKTLAELRKVSPAVARGSYQQKWVNSDILVFERKEGSDTVLVAVNKGPSTSISVSALSLADGVYQSLTGSDTVTVNAGQATLTLAQNEVIVLR
ncbi:alpha-amylase family glycosyl hydrolase [Aestuariibacter sp. AA17]|uniref:Alpha-amylase family glycosyl hydrolase n=1 Tax=Fluctibacter corallii TaxID=2984329 RepID=A0ABT3A7N8_9ALTE|nr:alpha-amylase family glycosyl hydrolase [Aestuariibacter sp. AA17]MCV2884302.1 alpha-amylase family glycosyl hydrolase [Aestuariibacter sp. AA17]